MEFQLYWNSWMPTFGVTSGSLPDGASSPVLHAATSIVAAARSGRKCVRMSAIVAGGGSVHLDRGEVRRQHREPFVDGGEQGGGLVIELAHGPAPL